MIESTICPRCDAYGWTTKRTLRCGMCAGLGFYVPPPPPHALSTSANAQRGRAERAAAKAKHDRLYRNFTINEETRK